MYRAISTLKPSVFRPLQRTTAKTAFSAYPKHRQYANMATSAAELVKSNRQTPGKLFEFQAQLAKLPVPSLSETLPKYLRTVEPLVSAEEFAHTKLAVQQFAASAQGKELQRRLEARAAEPGRANWLEEWWNDLSYMGYRDPVVPYVSYFYSYKDDPLRRTATGRAAAIVRAAWEFRRQVMTRELTPEATKAGVLCSHTYNFMFNACRIPVRPSDTEATYDLARNQHIVVARNAQFYALELVHDGRLLSAAEIEAQMDRIVSVADGSAAVPVGVLTSDNRDLWADNRQALVEAAPENALVLERLQSAAFVVCLDSEQPVTRKEAHRVFWHGNGRNRWFDKSLQFIVCDNAKAGFLGEHSSMDGTPTCRLSDYVLDQTLGGKVELGSPAVRPGLPTPELLRFVTPPAVVRAIKQAAARFDTVTAQHQLSVAHLGFGKDEIKKLGFSPDGFVQMAIQLGYYRMYGASRATYEAATTRRFAHGRTETCRSVSHESVAFCRVFADHASAPAKRLAALQAATSAHGAYAKGCAEGKGVDRHLLGLRLLIAPGEEKPKLFQDPAYAQTSHWYLSTSQLSSEHFEGWGFSEVVPDGYGVAYTIRRDAVVLHIANMLNDFGLNSEHLAHHIKEAAMEMRAAVLAAKLSAQGPKL